MGRRLALLMLALLPSLSGCTLVYGDRQTGPGSGGNGGGGGSNGGGGSGGGGACVPTGCADVGAMCGSITDGCGTTLACGDCGSGQTCGGAGPNRCGTHACVPQTCAQLNDACGKVSDGCAGVIDCGACACTPTTCAAQPVSCGNVPDGCGHTLDCGTCPPGTWLQIGNLSNNFVGVAYNSTSGLWLADDAGNVLHSTDDVHFTTQQLPGSLTALYADGDEVFAAGSNGIFHKAPGVTTFALVAASPGAVVGFHGTVAGYYAITYENNSQVYFSLDGVSWGDASPTPYPTHLTAIFSVSPLEAWAVGTGGAVYHTTDGGGTWSSKSLGSTVLPRSVWATTAAVFVAADISGIFRSADAGATWSHSPYGSDRFASVAGMGTGDIWAAGDNSAILHTTDDGVSWTLNPGVTGGAVFTAISAGTDRVYVVGENGAIAERRN